MTMAQAIDLAPDRTTLAIGARGPAFDGLRGTDGLRHGFSCVDRARRSWCSSSPRTGARRPRPTPRASTTSSATYGPLGVQLIAVNSNDPHLYPDERFERMVERATEDALRVPVRGRRRPGASRGRTARRARSTSSSSTATVVSATRAGSTTRASRATSRTTTSATRSTTSSPAGRSARRRRGRSAAASTWCRGSGRWMRVGALAPVGPSVGPSLGAGARRARLAGAPREPADRHRAAAPSPRADRGRPAAPVALAAFLLGWLVMVAAMMLPASLPTARAVAAGMAHLRRPRLAMAAFAAGVRRRLGACSGSSRSPATPSSIGSSTRRRGWRLGPTSSRPGSSRSRASTSGRRSSGASCSRAGTRRRASRRPIGRRTGAARLGLRHGLDCLGSSWALMLLMFAEGFANLWWMAALTAIMTYETSGRHGARLADLGGDRPRPHRRRRAQPELPDRAHRMTIDRQAPTSRGSRP